MNILTAEERSRLFVFLKEQISVYSCDGTLRHTKTWLENNMPANAEDIIEELESEGGYCDCEVIYNCLLEWKEK